MSADPMPAAASVRAAGGVVLRPVEGTLEVLVVHRPRYDDWSFPKGKVERDESDEDAARREVEEETGYRCELGAELPAVAYLDARGRHKTVRYWLMTVIDGQFRPNSEVDVLAWLHPESARDRLTYSHDQHLLDVATR